MFCCAGGACCAYPAKLKASANNNLMSLGDDNLKNMSITPKNIIDFWYEPAIKKQWFSATPELDQKILTQYEKLWEAAAAGELDGWCDDAKGCLALVIILDQFPLNMFRGHAKSFSSERKAVEIAWHAVKHNLDQALEKEYRAFLYMPFMHSEFMAEQDLSVKLFHDNQLDENLKFAEHHRNIVKQFGRFPHRNAILGRISTDAEIKYLESAGGYKG
jgi:uncharacterized protein (DUF924 family)